MGDVASLSIKVTQEGADQAAASLRGLSQAGGGAEASFGKLAMQIAGLNTGFGLAVQAGRAAISTIKSLSVESVQLAAGFEKARITWGVLVGDMEMGARVFEQIRQFSAETPLSFEGLNQAATTIKGFGVATEDLIPTLSKLGDIAMGDNQRLQQLSLVYGQVMAQGKAKTQDLYQFINAGVPIFNLLAESMNKSAGEIKELASEGAVTFEEIEKAISKATGEGGQFYGMMEKVSQSTSGKWSTALDNWKADLADLGERVLPLVNAALDKYNEAASKRGAQRNIEKVFAGEGGDIDAAVKEATARLERAEAGIEGLYGDMLQRQQNIVAQARATLVALQYMQLSSARVRDGDGKPATTPPPPGESEFMRLYYREGRRSTDPTSEIFMSAQGIQAANTALQEYLNLVNQITSAAWNNPWAKEESELSAGTATALADQARRASDITAQYADQLTTLQAQLSEVNLLYKNGSIDAGTYARAVVDIQNQIDNLDQSVVKFKESLSLINDYFGQLGQQAFVDSFKSIGAEFVSGKEGAESFADSMQNLAESILDNLPLMLLQAGLNAMSTPGGLYIGLGLIGASGLVAIGSGMYSASTNDNALGGVYSSRSLSSYSGSVYDKPQMFNFARGAAIGRFGEAGPEAIMPLQRMGNGKLGVASQSGGNVSVVVNNNAPNTTATATETASADGTRQIAVVVKSLVKQGLASGEFDSAMGRYGSRAVGVRR